MARYLRVFFAIVFWNVNVVHFQDAAVLKDDGPFAHVQTEPSINVTIDETNGLLHGNKYKESRLKRHAEMDVKLTKIQEEVKSLEKTDIVLQFNVTALEKRVDTLEKVDDKQNGVGDTLRNDITKVKKQVKDQLAAQKKATDRLRAKITSNITSIEENRAHQEIIYENLRSGLADARNELTSAVGNLKVRLNLHETTDGILSSNITSLQKRLDSQTIVETQLTSNLTSLQQRLNNHETSEKKITSDLTSVQKSLDKQGDTNARITSDLASVQGRLDAQENVDTKLSLDMNSLRNKLEVQEKADAKFTSDLTSLRDKLNHQESTDNRFSSNLTSLQWKLNDQESNGRQFRSDILDIRQKLTAAITQTQLNRKTSELTTLLQQVQSTWTSELNELQKKVKLLLNCKDRFENSCYSVLHEEVTWDTAQVKCEGLGGKLAEIESSEENEHLKKYATEVAYDGYWIGGTDASSEGYWKWASSYRAVAGHNTWNSGNPWQSYEPNNALGGENCLQMAWDRKWNDRVCTRGLYPLCEIELF